VRAYIIKCVRCGLDFDLSLHCPHCERNEYYPNVEMARWPDEVAALEVRFQLAMETARNAGREDVAKAFVVAVEEKSVAVLSIPLSDAEDVIKSGFRETYYRLGRDRYPIPRPPDTPDWEGIRQVIESKLFDDRFKYDMQFAALSLTGEAIASYGPVRFVCNLDLIAHRASAFHENSCVFAMRDDITAVGEVPWGYRSTWADRGKLSLAKMVEQLTDAADITTFQGLILRAGATPALDEFVEVHIFGKLSVKALGHAIVMLRKEDKRARVEDLVERLGAVIPTKMVES
jgi:hypothetical protein